MISLERKISLFKSLFNSRKDVFAIRWEKGSKSGYMPAFFFDPYRLRVHKMNGGTFKNYADKSYLQLTDEQIVKHLKGEQYIGLYPLCPPDNASWFIVADFDGGDWLKSTCKFIDACEHAGIPAYLERSRSGKGGHVWIFFNKPYSAAKSRRIVLSLLTSSGVISPFDKNISFDRLFPNQDYLSGGGLGNLIALPLNGTCLQQGNSCFLDLTSLQPYADQWQFMEQIKRASVEHLEMMLPGLKNGSSPRDNTGNLTIVLKENVQSNRNSVPTILFNFIREELNFSQTSWEKSPSGRSR